MSLTNLVAYYPGNVSNLASGHLVTFLTLNSTVSGGFIAGYEASGDSDANFSLAVNGNIINRSSINIENPEVDYSPDFYISVNPGDTISLAASATNAQSASGNFYGTIFGYLTPSSFTPPTTGAPPFANLVAYYPGVATALGVGGAVSMVSITAVSSGGFLTGYEASGDTDATFTLTVNGNVINRSTTNLANPEIDYSPDYYVSINFGDVITLSVANIGSATGNFYGSIFGYLGGGSLVQYNGPIGPTGPIGPVGPSGASPATITQAFQIFPVGIAFPINVSTATPFPLLSYIVVSNGVYSVVAKVVNPPPGVPQSVNQLYIQTADIINGVVGSVLNAGSTVSFSGPPSNFVASNSLLGLQGTALYSDQNFSTTFNSTNGITSSTILGTPLLFQLPTTSNLTWRVIVDLTATVATQQFPNSNIVYLGIGTTTLGQNQSQTFTAIGTGIQPAATIPNATCVADGIFTSATTLNPNGASSQVVKYIATYNSSVQLAFSLLASSFALNSLFYVNGVLSLTVYPIYSTT